MDMSMDELAVACCDSGKKNVQRPWRSSEISPIPYRILVTSIPHGHILGSPDILNKKRTIMKLYMYTARKDCIVLWHFYLIIFPKSNFHLPSKETRERLKIILIPRDASVHQWWRIDGDRIFWRKKNPASAISPLVVSHVRRAAGPFVFVHFCAPGVREKMPACLFVTKPKPQITRALQPSARTLPRAHFARDHTRPCIFKRNYAHKRATTPGNPAEICAPPRD